MKGSKWWVNLSCILIFSFLKLSWRTGMWQTDPPTSFCRGRVFTEQWQLLTQKTNEAVPEERNIRLQTLIIWNKDSEVSRFFENSLEYYFDVSEAVGLRELFSKDSKRTSTRMWLSPHCPCTSSDGTMSAWMQLYFISNRGSHHLVVVTL